MATAWQTLEEAALTLGISSRTLARRLARGEFETRMEAGRREVLISITEPELSATNAPAELLSDMPTDVADSADDENQTQFDELTDDSHAQPTSADMSADVGHTMLALHEDRIRRTDLAIMAYQQSVNMTAADAQRTHRNLRIAWSMAGGLAVASFIAAVWATHSVTQAQAEVKGLSATVRQLSDTSDNVTKTAEKLRAEAETAKIAAARAEGQLDAAKSRIDQLVQEQSALQTKVAMQNSAAVLASAVTVPATQPAATTQPFTSAR